MADKQRAKAGKKSEKEAGQAAADGQQVTVDFSVAFTVTPAAIPPPPCTVYDSCFSFSFLSLPPASSPPVGQWVPVASISDSSAEGSLPAPVAVTWEWKAQLSVDRELLLRLEQEMLKVVIEQKQAAVEPEPAPSTVPAEELQSPKKGKAAPPAAAAVAVKKKKETALEEERKSSAHPALTDDIPFVPVASFLLPLSALLSAPHSASLIAPSPGLAFTLPAGLSSLSCVLHTNHINPIHPTLLPSLLPLTISLQSLSPLTPPSASSSQPAYRPLSLCMSLPSYPHALAASTSFTSSSSLSFSSSLLPSRTVFLSLLPASTLYELSSDAHAGIAVEVRDRDAVCIPSQGELEEQAREKARKEEEQRREEEARLKEEEKKKKQEKKPPQLKSPTAAKSTPAAVDATAAPAAAATETSAADSAPPPPAAAVVYDTRSNVFGMATLPLQELFDASVSSVSALTPVSPVYPPVSVPMLPFTHRANPYSGTVLSYTLTLQHPLPSRASLAAAAPYCRLAAVMEDAAWSAVYELILTANAAACGVEDGRAPGAGSWSWLDAVMANAEEAAAETEVKQTEAEKEADKPVATRVREKSDAKPVKKTAKVDDKAAPPAPLSPPAADLPLPAVYRARGDYLTGCFVTDGKTRWLMLEGLAPAAASSSAFATVLSALFSLRQRQPGKTRLYSDGSLRFPSRLYPSCPLSLLHLRLPSPLSSFLSRVVSPCFLSLNKLSLLFKGEVVRSLGDVSSARVWLAEEEVRRLQAECGRTETLEDVYGKELSRREKEVKKQQRLKREQEQREQQEELRRQQEEKERLERQLAEQTQPTASPEQAAAPAAAAAAAPEAAVQAQADAASVDATLTATLTATIAAESAVSPLPQTAAAKKQPRSAPHPAPSLPSLTYDSPASYQACLRALREACHADRAHHYTFHVDYLHSSIPRYESQEEYERLVNRQQRSRWLTQRGFVTCAAGSSSTRLFSDSGLLSGHERQLEREERRRQRSLDELVEQRWQQRQQRYERRREVQFYTQPLFPSLFDRSPQRSIHLTTEAELQQQKAELQRQQSAWEEKILVSDPNFHVLWKSPPRLQTLRQDPAVKLGLLPEVQSLPVSITNTGQWSCPADLSFRDSGNGGEGGEEEKAEFVRYFFPHRFVHRPKMKAEKH